MLELIALALLQFSSFTTDFSTGTVLSDSPVTTTTSADHGAGGWTGVDADHGAGGWTGIDADHGAGGWTGVDADHGAGGWTGR
ncbi:hypothetical protein [Hymenobacter sp. BT190]|uniref:hypothetical protein n=1 Tax=Hymenobacter sp. BT190 TaxID=2763505 RepID=UPI00165172EB|nr:hypothetical protein [Hymenobacter sp. BT190]MBC6696882.1 hypothetical protein [Hymenobacter sp. BT190]